MSSTRMFLTLVLTMIAVAGVRSQERDLREQYGTRSLETAKAISQAIELAQARKYKEARPRIEAALKADAKCQMAHYWKGLICGELGDVTEAIDAYKTSLSDDIPRARLVSANAAMSLGILLGKLKEYDESCLWLSRAVMEDPNNASKLRGRAYRNMAISLSAQGKHMPAAIAVALAYQDKAANVDAGMVRAFFSKVGDEEVARLLHFKDAAPKIVRRESPAKIAPLSGVQAVADKIADLLPDPQGRYVLALASAASHYWLISTDGQPQVRLITVDKPILCACLSEGHLYAVTSNPLQINKIDASRGKVLQTYAVHGSLPTSLTVFPTQGRAFLAMDRMVHDLNLRSGRISKTDIPGEALAGDPGQRFLYTYLKPEDRGGGGGHIIINGRPIFFQPRVIDYLQTTLFKAVVAPEGLLIAEVRDNAASNAARLSLSPDGHWVAVAGGGGWRPTAKQAGWGYGVAVFDAHNLENVQGFFKTDAYPIGVCFNPVTSQVAVLRSQDAHVYHLADANASVTLAGRFAGPATWSGDGKYLVLADDKSGVAIFENTLLPAEATLAVNWWKNIHVARPAAAARATFQAVESLRQFVLADPSRTDLARRLAQVASARRTDKPGSWQEYAPYIKDDSLRQTIQEVQAQISRKEDVGIAIFRLKKAIQAQPDSVPAQFFLAEAMKQSDQPEEAEQRYLTVVHGDAGRTELSCLALNRLAALAAAKGRDLAALDCLAASLALDAANPQTIASAVPLLRKQQFDAVADQLARLTAGAATAPPAGLPDLPKPSDSKTYLPAELYRKAVWSVVLIKSGKASGSGVCVGSSDIVVTNNHVIEGDDPIEVISFILRDNAVVRMPALRASILARSGKEDLAVLKLEKAPEQLRPLAVATANPGPGEKVYAMGSPGLGAEVLEQSISEGLVSTAGRVIDGHTYLQHSAAVNPGNSGGPLLDDHCRVVGIVTLKARLENVSFAIPAETIRGFFNSR
jgi:S1-C subfamily serine protease/DNA-binding beta-propeller fold protein YncE